MSRQNISLHNIARWTWRNEAAEVTKTAAQRSETRSESETSAGVQSSGTRTMIQSNGTRRARGSETRERARSTGMIFAGRSRDPELGASRTQYVRRGRALNLGRVDVEM